MKPRLLDLFCGAGGAGMGYHLAGFDVVGVDIDAQPHYPFAFHQADAMTFPLDGFDAIHASPPCQAYSIANNIHGRGDHPDLLPATRDRLVAWGCPWVIENVPGAPMRNWITVCGRALGLGVKRHRWFESSVALMVPPCPHNLRSDPSRLHATDRRATALGDGGGSVSTTAERSPCWQPWESRPHIRASAVTACVGGRWVVAASAHPRSGDGGLGVALAKAERSLSNACAQSGKVPANEVVPAQCDLPGTRTRPDVEVMP